MDGRESLAPPAVRDRPGRDDVETPTREACAAWERSLRPGQYFSEKGGHRPMRHRTQAVQGHHAGARAWPRGPDGGAWGPQHLSPIPSEKDYVPLVPSPTASPGRRSPSRAKKPFFSDDGLATGSRVESAASVADGIAVEIGLDGAHRDVLKPFEPVALDEEVLPQQPPLAPHEAPWRAPPPGFDVRTLRRQAAALRSDAVDAFRDEDGVRRSSLRLAETLAVTVENARENASLGKIRLCDLHAVVRRMREERARRGEAVKAAVAWQESLDELREKLASAEDQQRRAGRAETDVRRTLEAAIDANGKEEAKVILLEEALEAAWRRDDVAAEMVHQTRQEEIADAFYLRRRRRSSTRSSHGYLTRCDANALHSPTSSARVPESTMGRHFNDGVSHSIDGVSSESGGANDELAGHVHASPFVTATMSRGFHALVEACRRSKGMRQLTTARRGRESVEHQHVKREAFAAWAVAAVLEREERGASRRRAAETARLCFARWRLFAALERRFRRERRRRMCLRVLNFWRDAVTEGRRERELDRRREVFMLHRCFQGWRVLRARSILTPQELVQRRTVADRHRLHGLFETWHLACLASIQSSSALVRGFRRRRDRLALAADFQAWASLARARRWRRRALLRLGIRGLSAFLRADASKGWKRRDGDSKPMTTTRRFEPARSDFNQGGGRQGEEQGEFLVREEDRSWMREGDATEAAMRLSSSDGDTLAAGHRRQVVLSKALEAFREGTHQRRRVEKLLFCSMPPLSPGSTKIPSREGAPTTAIGSITVSRATSIATVTRRAVRDALLTWFEMMAVRRRVETGLRVAEDWCQRRRILKSTREWHDSAAATARRRRAHRARVLRASFTALRQACVTARRKRTASVAMHHIVKRRYVAVARYTMLRLSAGSSRATAARTARARFGAARRRREREALAGAWRWWVGGWLKRRAVELRTRELQAHRTRQREGELAEQLLEASRVSSALQKEAHVVETELQMAKLLVLEQEEALVAARKSWVEANAAAAAVKAHLRPSAPVKIRKQSRAPGSKATMTQDLSGKNTVVTVTKGGQCEGQHGNTSGARGFATPGKPHTDEDRRLQRGRIVRRGGAASVLQAAEARKQEAADMAAAKERAAGNARGKLIGQEEADRAALEGARTVARRFQGALEQEEALIADAEGDRLRMQAATARLLERADNLERRAEGEEMQGARIASGAESERATLSLEVSTSAARAREIMRILEEREQEAATLRRALAAKDVEREEARYLDPSPPLRQERIPPRYETATTSKRKDVYDVATPKSPRTQPPRAAPHGELESSEGLGDSSVTPFVPERGRKADPARCDLQELKKSIATLQEKVIASSRKHDNSN